MDTSFKEKSLWIQLLALVLVFGSYFVQVILAGEGAAHQLGYFIGMLVVLVVINVLGHSVAAVLSPPEHEDERDKRIQLTASRTKAHVLAAGSLITIAVSLILHHEFLTLHLLLLFLVIAEVAEKSVQLVYYRKGF